MVSYVSLLPEQHVGIVVLTNQQSGAAMSVMMQSLLDAFLGKPPRDWLSIWKDYDAKQAEAQARADRDADAAIRADGRACLSAPGRLCRDLSRPLARRRGGEAVGRKATASCSAGRLTCRAICRSSKAMCSPSAGTTAA